MARYIDADKLVEMYERSVADDWNKKTAPSSWADAYDCVIADIDDQPTADVAPKSEVAREIFEEIYKSVASKIPMGIRPIFKDDRDFDGGFINGKRDALLDVLVLIAELKKKYTEGK